MMRVTPQMGTLQAQRDIQQRTYELYRRQREASTGVALNMPSDDPAGAAQLTHLGAARSAATQFGRNVDRGMTRLEAQEGALSAATDLLQRASELAVQMANGSIGAQERATAADEIAQLHDQLVALANTRSGDTYIFAGDLSDRAAFADSGSGYAYQGDAGQYRVQVDASLVVDVGVTGAEAFAVAGGEDAFAALKAFEAGLRADDLTAVRASTASLERARQQVTVAEARVGQHTRTLVDQADILRDTGLQLDQEEARVKGADAVETFSGLAKAQQALENSVQVSAKLLSTLTLVDKL